MNDDNNLHHHLDLPSDNFSPPNLHQFESQSHLHPTFHPQSQSLQRRPRGFAANVTTTTPVSTPSAAPEAGGRGGGKGRREREKEKERTKLRERHRRAITSRMLAGLRQYGNFPLPARADMNDVLAALAREAGWTVDADGTTYRPPPSQQIPMTTFPVTSIESPISASPLKKCSTKSSSDCQPSVLQINESLYRHLLILLWLQRRKLRGRCTLVLAPTLSVHLIVWRQIRYWFHIKCIGHYFSDWKTCIVEFVFLCYKLKCIFWCLPNAAHKRCSFSSP